MKVLIADDDLEVMDLTVAALSRLKNNPEIKTVDTGIDAWKEIKNFLPDLLVLDLKMPGIYGTNICEKLRRTEIGKKMKILVMTSYLTPGVRKMVEESGSDVCIEKPFDPNELLKMAEELMAQKP